MSGRRYAISSFSPPTSEIGIHVDVDYLLGRVAEAKAEFEEREDDYSDHMQDEHKERYHFDRDADRSISDMFGSLRGDRD